MNFIFYVIVTIATAVVSILSIGGYLQGKSQEIVNNYQGIKNLGEADSQSELAALKNKRFYGDSGIKGVLNGNQELLLQDVSFMQKDAYRDYVNQNVDSDYKGYGSNSDRNGSGKGTYAGGQKGIDLNVDLSTKKLSLDNERNVLNSFTNNVYELPINSNIQYLSNNNDQLFSHLQIRWGDGFNGGDSNFQGDIQVTLYRFKVGQDIDFNRGKMLDSFYNGNDKKSQGDVLAKKILRMDQSSDSRSNGKESSTLNPQAEFFHKVADINDLVSNADMKPQDYIYYLVIESLSSNPIPVLIEAYNTNGQPVGFVGDYKTTYDSTGIGLGNNRKRVQLYQTLKNQKMKYFNKSIFTQEDLVKEIGQ